MKQHYIYGLFAAALTLGACDYNEDNFPGFDELAQPTHVWSDTITLVKSDYKKIAELEANQELALSKDPEGGTYVAALEALADNKFFTEDAPALWYLPAYVAEQYPYMDNKSKVTVYYDEYASALPAYLIQLAAAKTYTFDSDDYKTVWGEEKNVSFISPASKNKISDALNAGISSPRDGEVRMVSYAWSATEPSFGGGTEEPEPSYTSIADVIAAGKGDFTAKGEVIATYAQGFLLSDGTASVLVFLKAPANYSVGDVVTVSGSVSVFNGLTQFPQSSEVTFVERSEEFAYPAPMVMSGSDLESWITSPVVKYASVKGKLTQSGNYYNLEIDGCTKQGSIKYPANGLIDESLIDQQVTVTGYLIGGGEKSKYIDIMTTSVVATGNTSDFIPVGVVALSEAGSYKVKGSVVALYKNGFLLNDATGSILVYKNNGYTNKIGDVVTVSGSTSSYAGFMQYKDATVETVKEAAADFQYTYPAVKVMEAADLDAYLSNPFIGYVQYTGQLKIDGKYMNVIFDGAETAQGSLSYTLDGQVDEALNGKYVTVTGYTIGVSSGKFVNTMVLKIEEAAVAASTFALTRAAVTPNANALYTYSATTGKWREFTQDGVDVSVLQPADYNQMGYNYISKPEETLPIYLSRLYPYAKADDVATVVYANDSKNKEKLGATEFKFNGSVWTETSETAASVITFQKSAGVWVEAKVYLEESFDGSAGGFVPNDVLLPAGSNYVWKLDSYGYWKGSGFVGGGNKKAESYLVSPEIDLTKAGMPVVVFDCAINFLNDNELGDFFNLVVSEDYTDGKVTEATWETLEVKGWPEGTSWDFATVEPVDLTAYAGKKIYLAFHYKSTDEAAPTVEIKNLSVKE